MEKRAFLIRKVSISFASQEVFQGATKNKIKKKKFTICGGGGEFLGGGVPQEQKAKDANAAQHVR